MFLFSLNQRRFIFAAITILMLSFIYWLGYVRKRRSTTRNAPSVSHWARLSDPKLDIEPIHAPAKQARKTLRNPNVIIRWIQDPNFYTLNKSHYAGEYDHVLNPMHQFIDGKTGTQVVQHREANQQRLMALLNQSSSLEQQIPSMVHYVWITSLQSPYLIPKEKLDRFFKQVDAFPANFVQYFWLFGKQENRNNIKQLEKYPGYKKLTLRDLREEQIIQYGADLFDIYYEQKRYTYCSDLARLNLVYLYGGFYLDLGVRMKVDTLSDLQLFSYVGYQEGYVCSNSFLAAKPRSWVFYAFLHLLDNLHRLSEPTLRSLQLKSGMVHWSSLGGLTWAFDTFLRDSETYLPLDQSLGVIQTQNMASWVHGKLGQPSLKSQPLQPKDSFFTRVRLDNPRCYSNARDLWNQNVSEYMASGFGKSLEEIRVSRRHIEETCMKIVYNNTFPLDITQDPKIPRILHRCWLTTSNREVRRDQLLDILFTYRLLERSYYKWTFYFWTNDPRQIPKTIEFFKKYCPETIIRTLDVSRDIPYARDIYQALFDDGRFANANDILRVNLMVKYGGVYMDMGIRMQYDLSALLIPFDNALIFHDEVLDTGCFAAAPGDPMFQEWLDFLHHKRYKSFKRDLFDTPLKQMPITGCHYLMTLLDIKYSTRKVLILRDQFFVQLNQLRSWHGLLKKSKVDLWKI
jgi:hypothetical protein